MTALAKTLHNKIPHHNSSSRQKRASMRSSFLTQRDFIAMSLLTLLFAVLAFFRLGNTYAPETSYTFTQENRDIILDFGSYTDISSISIFLEAQNTRHFAISAYNEVTEEWEIFDGAAEFESVFTWNKMELNYNLRYMGIVLTDEEAVINEIVFQAPDGSILVPVNAQEYPELFDEQDMFPQTKTYMDGTIFDEIYHGRTAYEFIHHLTTYETTHPHLGKILISVGILLFGMNPFGWRFMSVIFGILMVPLMYLFARRLFKDTYIATATTALLVFDCMHYTLSRIATIDVFIAFFILLMYYYMYQYLVENNKYRQTKAFLTDSFLPRNVYLPLALSGIGMALGVATKFTGIYAGAGLAILFVWHNLECFPKAQVKKLFPFCCLFFIIIPLFMYAICFIPVVGYTPYDSFLDKVIEGTRYMIDYHSNLVAEHYYSSPFYEWPIIWMPLLYANDAVNATDVSAISCMGNPAIWWVGIICVLYVFFRFIVKRDKKAGFLCISYLAQYLPWMSVGRITFIYHYFPAILFTMLMMGYTMQHIRERFSWGKKATAIYMAIAVICFAIFFPVISGLPIYREWGLNLRWLKDWILVL